MAATVRADFGCVVPFTVDFIEKKTYFNILNYVDVVSLGRCVLSRDDLIRRALCCSAVVDETKAKLSVSQIGN